MADLKAIEEGRKTAAQLDVIVSGIPANIARKEVNLEVEEHLKALLEEHGATWDGHNDPQDPYNWSVWRKILTAIIVSCGQLICLMTTSMIAAPLATIAQDLGMNLEQAQIAFSIFILGLAIGPFLVASLSEMYGRRPVWIISNIWYILWNSLCPVGHSKGLMVLGRFLAGIGASVGVTLTGPVLTDLYRKEDRGKSLAIATFIPYFGPALGPIIGGLVSQYIRWEWLFWVLSIATAVNTLVGFCFIRESYTPILLQKKAMTAGGSNSSHLALNHTDGPSFLSRLQTNLLRPWIIFWTRPIIQIVAFGMALDFGIYCVVLSIYANFWIERYGETNSTSSLHYIAIAVGAVAASQGGGYMMDVVFRLLRDRNNGQTRPEYRMPFLIPSVLLAPAGLFLYGWAAHYKTYWLVVDVGVVIFTLGLFMFSQGLLAYIYDEFTHAASANAASRWLSNIFGFCFPIFAPQLYIKLGYGWGNSLLALIFIVFGVPIPLLLWYHGSKLRKLGQNA